VPAAALLGLAMVVLPAVAASETGAAIEAVNKPGGGLYGEETHAWSPTAVTVSAGGTVTLSNRTAIEHGVHWVGGPEAPGCSGIPVGTTSAARGANWSGTCTFAKPGTYTFYCTVHGPEMTGTITVKNPGTPIVTTEPSTELTQATARLNGAVNPEGNATEYRFDYGASTVSEHMTSTLSLGSEDFSRHLVSAALTGLTPGTSYHVQLVAIYGAGKTTVLGGERMFTSPVPAAPTVATGQATALRETEATLNGAVDANEGEATEYSFDYGSTLSYGQSTEPKSLPADRASRTVAATLTGLAPGTEYHFRLVAHNKVGPVTGEDHTFTTASPPPTMTKETPPSQPPASGPSGTTLGAPDLSAFVPISPAAGIPIGSPLVRGSHALTLAASQHGSSVHGSIDVSSAGAGGKLEVAVFAPGASLAVVRHPAGVRVGRLLRSAVRAGVVSFTAPLSARARTALHRHHRLGLTVQIVLTPLAGAPASMTRSVVLRG